VDASVRVSRYAISFGRGRAVAGQDDFVITPTRGASGRRVVIACHGQLQATLAWLSPGTPGQYGIVQSLAAAGFVVIGGYYDGPMWGNDAAVADIEAFRVWAGTLGCVNDKVLLVGASMGHYDAAMYAAAHPDRVAAIASIIPGIDIDDVRDNNKANARDYVNTAWGTPAGSTSATNALPAAAKLLDPAKVAAVASAGAPIKMYYSTADTVILPSSVPAYRDAINTIVPGLATATVVSSTLDHSDAAMGAMPMPEVVRFLDQHVTA
jgi:pimeloyl-ACP methyl ester carboxylesterase